MRPRIVDWALALAVGAAFGSGLWTLTSGSAEQRLVFALHDGIGMAFAVLVVLKLHRVRWRLLPRWSTGWPRVRRDPRILAGVAATMLALLTLVSGIGWVHGGTFVAWGYNLLNWHIVAAFVLVGSVSAHMLARAKPLRQADTTDRRQALRLGGVFVGGLLAVPIQQLCQRVLHLPGSARRFTGSREVASFDTAFPVVSWVADAPRPIDTSAWQLVVSGAVRQPLALRYDDIDQRDVLEATLDCTGGFYSTQSWRGLRVGTLLDQAGLAPDATYVRFRSVTGYRWSLPIAAARDALVATHVADQVLSHGHGAPARLVAPGERGFVWVKWLVALEVLTAPDLGQLVAINTSSLSAAGRGE